MKKIMIALLIMVAMTVAVTTTADVAFADCGKCGIEAAANAECTCHGKKWYNPISWFKKCPVCKVKEEV